MIYRVEVRLKGHLPDARGLGLVRDIHDLGITTVSDARVVDIYWLDGDFTADEVELICQRLLVDAVTQEYRCSTSHGEIKAESGYHAVEVAYNAGVTDPLEDTVIKAVADLGLEGLRAVKSARRYLLQGQLDERELETICTRLLVNPIIQHVVKVAKFEFAQNPQYSFRLEQVALLEADKARRREIGQQFGFSDSELQAITTYFDKEKRNPTDVELETLAQT